MHRESKIEWQLVSGDWWYTFALALCLGLVLAGAFMLVRAGRDERKRGLAVLGCGLAGALFTSTAGLNGSPWNVIDMDVHPYLSHLIAAAMLGLAVLLGVAVSAAVVFAAARTRAAAAIQIGVAVIGVGILLAIVVSQLGRFQAPSESPRHPSNTDTSHKLPYRELADGFSTPVGLSIAPNGDLAVVELNPPALSLFAIDGTRVTLRSRVDLSVPAGGQAFHVVFHPDYPNQPYAFVTAEEQGPDRRTLQVLRVRLDVDPPQVQPVITGLPIGQVEVSNHFGGGIAVCGGELFVSTADTEPNVMHELPLGTPGVIRQLVQDPLSGIGKVMRWRLTGADVVPDGQVEGEFPEYALGFRNPFSMTCDPVSGNPVVADNGPAAGHDQVRVVGEGTNHEWPLSSRRVDFTLPLFDTESAHVVPTGIAVRPEGDGYEYLVTGFFSESLDAFQVDSGGKLVGKYRLLAEVKGGAYAVAVDGAGCVYFTSAEALFRLEDGRCQ